MGWGVHDYPTPPPEPPAPTCPVCGQECETIVLDVYGDAVAVDDGKTRDGDKKTVFVNCVAWEKTAEFIDEYFKKGDGITLFGKVQSRQYEHEGQKRTAFEVVVNGVEFPLSHRSTDGSD